MKKILLFFVLFFISFLNVYGDLTKEQTSIKDTYSSMSNTEKAQFEKMEIPSPDGMGMTTVGQAMKDGYLSDGITGPSTEAALDAAGRIKSGGASTSGGSSTSGGAGDLTSTDFKIAVDSISPGIVGEGSTTSERINWLLGTLIQKMMIALGVLSVFIMSIGAGYMILHNGQDELLSKGKSIFMSGVYAMIVALTSYYLISLVRYLLYNVN